MLRRSLWSLAALIVLLTLAAAWTLYTESGARFVAGVAKRALDDKLASGIIEGTIAGGLRITDLRWRDTSSGVWFHAGEVRATLAPGALLAGTLRLRALTLHDVLVELTTVAPPLEEKESMTSLEAPIDIVLDDFTLERGELRRDGATSLALTRAALTGEWTQSGIELRSARVVGRNGELSLDARLHPRAPWLEHATGTVDWRAGDRRWQGTLASVREAGGISLRGALTAPLNVTLTGSVSREGDRPWRLKVSIPRFDPRRDLVPDSELESLAAEFEAHGAKARANIEGHIGIDGETLAIRELAIEFTDGQVVARALRVGIADAPGEVRGNARVRFGESVPGVFANLKWKSLTLPARWVGEPLATSGRLLFEGNAEHFETKGTVEVAREKFQTALAWKADGSRDMIHLREGRVSQAQGELTIDGELDSPHRCAGG